MHRRPRNMMKGGRVLGYADGGAPERDPFEVAAERQRRAARSPRREGFTTKLIEAPGKIAGHFLTGAVRLPEEAFKASTRWSETGEYDPEPFVGAAMGVTGGRFPFAKRGEVGAGGGRPISPEQRLGRQEMEEALQRIRGMAPEDASQFGRPLGRDEPLRGLPQKPVVLGGEPFIPGPSVPIRELARTYMAEKGMPYTPLQNYVPVDVPRAKRIAQEYERMPNAPHDPAVMRSYDALARETRDQYEVLKRMGVKFEPMPAVDHYAANPRLAIKDLLENRHMYYFPSEQGFGSAAGSAGAIEQPLLRGSGVKIAGKEVPFNDLFRIVHDVFGHGKEGVGFRAAGEENAWRSHSRMYSPEALPVLTSELRGQNSWLNYGPFAEKNKGASAADTIYAPQKIGMLPRWVIDEGRMNPLAIAPPVAGFGALAASGDDRGMYRGGAVRRPPRNMMRGGRVD